MRFLHTADWHIGKALRGRSRLDEQESTLNEVLQIAIRERIDCLGSERFCVARLRFVDLPQARPAFGGAFFDRGFVQQFGKLVLVRQDDLVFGNDDLRRIATVALPGALRLGAGLLPCETLDRFAGRRNFFQVAQRLIENAGRARASRGGGGTR